MGYAGVQLFSTADLGNQAIKSLVYGGSGAGKTVLCSTAPAPIIISAEAGLLSLLKIAREQGRGLPYIPIRSVADMWGAYNWCIQAAEARQFYTVCVDSISEIAEVLLNEQLKKSKDPRQAYGELLTQGVAWARAFRDVPNKAVCILCKEEYSKDGDTNAMQFGPMLPGNKLGQQLPYFFDEVFQLYVHTDKTRWLRTQRSFQHIAKDRSGMLAEFEPANLTHVYRKIMGQ